MYSVTQTTNLPCYLISQGISVGLELERQRELLTLELWIRRRVHEKTEFSHFSWTVLAEDVFSSSSQLVYVSESVFS